MLRTDVKNWNRKLLCKMEKNTGNKKEGMMLLKSKYYSCLKVSPDSVDYIHVLLSSLFPVYYTSVVFYVSFISV